MTRFNDAHKIKRMQEMNRQDRANAQQGEFFLANVITAKGEIIPHPVCIVGKHNDSNDTLDIIACLCTHNEPRDTTYSHPVKLKDNSFVRCNKIYLIHRDGLLHKIRRHNVTPQDIVTIKSKAVNAIN